VRVGIVGNGEDKFTSEGTDEALAIIRELVAGADVVVSGHSPVGGIDIWAEWEAMHQGKETDIYAPETFSWNGRGGYRARNLKIARNSDVVHVILADVYPERYEGMRFGRCYHCKTSDHVKSGGCWTGKQAAKLGKPVVTHIVHNY
jgi:hypothetical protein